MPFMSTNGVPPAVTAVLAALSPQLAVNAITVEDDE